MQVEKLFAVGSLADHRFVFLHVVRTRNISEWSNFVQFPTQPVWTKELRTHFLQMLIIFLSPLKNKGLNLDLKLSQEMDGGWVEIDPRVAAALNDDNVSLRLKLNESDFCWILERFPFRPFLYALFADVCSGRTSMSVLSQMFGIAKAIMSLLANGLATLVEYTQFAKLLAKTISWVSWIMVEVYTKTRVCLGHLKINSSA